MAAARAFQQAVITMSMRSIGFDRAFRNIRKGSKDSESALQKMAGGLAQATEGTRSFVKEGVEGALEMSTRLRRMNVVMGGTAEGIEGLRKEQARVRVETGMTAEEADRLRLGLLEIGETSVDTALKAAKMTQALEIDPETTVGWFRVGKQMKMTATQTESMVKEAAGLLLTMKVPPTKFFEQPAEVAEIMRTRMLALGKQGPEAVKRFVKGGAALTAMMSKAGFGTDEAAAAMTQYAQQSADAMFDIRKMTAGLSGTELPELVKMTSITMESFSKAVEGAAAAPDVLLGQLASMTADLRAQGKDLTNWTAFVEQSVGDKRLAQLIVNNTDSVIQANKLAAGTTATLTARFDEMLAAALKSPEALRKMRDEQLKVLQESVALNEVFPITNKLVELQTRAIHFLATEHDGFTGAIAGVGRGTFAVTGLIGDAADKFADFTGTLKRSREGVEELAKGYRFLQKDLKGTLGTFARVGTALRTFTITTIPAAAVAVKGFAVSMGTMLVGALQAFAATMMTTVLPAVGAFLVAAAPVLLIAAALVAATAAIGYALDKYAEKQEKAGRAALKMADRQTQAMKATVALDKELGRQFAGELKGAKTEEERGRIISRQETMLQARGALPVTNPETAMPSQPTPVTAMGAFSPGTSLIRVAIQSLEMERSQVGLLEQLVALMGGLPGAMTPPMAGAGAGGGGVNVTIRPDSGRMQLHKMLDVEARNQLGRAGYTQLGGLTHTA